MFFRRSPPIDEGEVQRLRQAQEGLQQQLSQAREREAHLHSILETVPDAMVVIDERGILESLSKAAEKLFGYPASEVLSWPKQEAEARAYVTNGWQQYALCPQALTPNRPTQAPSSHQM